MREVDDKIWLVSFLNYALDYFDEEVGRVGVGVGVEPEVCNNFDEDCDTLVDENVVRPCYTGAPETLQVGVCQPGEQICNAGQWYGQAASGRYIADVCGGEVLPSEEICDGADNDCDGQTDEDLYQPCYTACGTGVAFCNNGNWNGCTAPPELPEICDGFDNDCDGAVDEGLDCLCTVQDIGTLFPCEEDPLVCGSGYKTCECKTQDCTVIGFTPCYAMCYWNIPVDPNCDPYLGSILPYELCNNHDDNCNQLIDEDLYKPCYTGPPETLNVGICLPGEQTCEKGAWGHHNASGVFIEGYCKDEVLPLLEDQCNGEDDDCDGETDKEGEMEETDILFIIDWSGSMSSEIEAVLMALNQFAKNYKDENVIQWGLIVGPRVPGNYGAKNYLEIVSNLAPFEDFMNKFSSLNKNTMNGQHEMLYDALYLSLMDLTGTEPWALNDLTWTTMVGNAIQESIPELQNFKINLSFG